MVKVSGKWLDHSHFGYPIFFADYLEWIQILYLFLTFAEPGESFWRNHCSEFESKTVYCKIKIYLVFWSEFHLSIMQKLSCMRRNISIGIWFSTAITECSLLKLDDSLDENITLFYHIFVVIRFGCVYCKFAVFNVEKLAMYLPILTNWYKISTDLPCLRW